MNSSSVLQIAPKVAKEPAKGQIIMGLVPSQNQFILNSIAPVIMPGLKELADQSMGGFTPGNLLFDVLYGQKQLHLYYLNRVGELKPEEFQAEFARRLQEPAKDFAAFSIIEPLREAGFHIYAAFVMPEFRESTIMQLGLSYLEAEARKMGSPYLSLSTRADVSGGLERLGYVLTTANYRKKLKE